MGDTVSAGTCFLARAGASGYGRLQHQQSKFQNQQRACRSCPTCGCLRPFLLCFDHSSLRGPSLLRRAAIPSPPFQGPCAELRFATMSPAPYVSLSLQNQCCVSSLRPLTAGTFAHCWVCAPMAQPTARPLHNTCCGRVACCHLSLPGCRASQTMRVMCARWVGEQDNCGCNGAGAPHAV